MANDPELISLDEAAVILGFTKLYVRSLVRKGKLKTKKVKLGPASQVWKHMLLKQDVEDMVKGGRPGHRVRMDGRYKYVLYASHEELERIKELLTNDKLGEVAELIVKTPSTSAYQLRKKKAAEKVVTNASTRQRSDG